MNKSIIVYGPQGCGKTRWAERIAKHFGLATVVDDWDGLGLLNCFNTLYLTAQTANDLEVEAAVGYDVRPFAEVAQQINDAIPLTPWQSGPPPMVGEWSASIDGGSDHIRRWWDGERWSFAWSTDDNQAEKRRRAGRRTYVSQKVIQWRGLAEEPIVVAT
jgi:hypothetical protein